MRKVRTIKHIKANILKSENKRKAIASRVKHTQIEHIIYMFLNENLNTVLKGKEVVYPGNAGRFRIEKAGKRKRYFKASKLFVYNPVFIPDSKLKELYIKYSRRLKHRIKIYQEETKQDYPIYLKR